MEKIRILSNYPVKQPTCLENIDLSLGVSYFCFTDNTVKTIQNDWGFNTVAKIIKMADYLTSPFTNNQEIVLQVAEDSNFIAQHYVNNSNNLTIQINHDNIASKALNYLAVFNILRKFNITKPKQSKTFSTIDDVMSGVDSKMGQIYCENKSIFLGTQLFEKSNSLYKSIEGHLTKKEAISFVFFHEYSHSAEVSNTDRYGNQSFLTDSSFDTLFTNLKTLTHSANFIKFFNQYKETYQETHSFPKKLLIDNLYTVQKEMYADVHAFLLMRNKALIENNFNSDRFSELISHISNMRLNEKNEYSIAFKVINEPSILGHEHFTSPALDSLLPVLNDICKEDKNKIFSEEELHNITFSCVLQGIGKTVLTLLQADKNLSTSFNTLFSLNLQEDKLLIDSSKNHYEEAIDKLKHIVDSNWQEKLQNNLDTINKVDNSSRIKLIEDLIFDAGTDQTTFNSTIEQYLSNKNNTAHISLATAKIKSSIVSLRDNFFSQKKSSTFSPHNKS